MIFDVLSLIVHFNLLVIRFLTRCLIIHSFIVSFFLLVNPIASILDSQYHCRV